MKKTFVVMIVLVAMAVSVSAFAVTQITNGSPATIGGAVFTPSQNVIISAASITTNYSATSAHQNAASGPGYEYQIDNTYNGIMKKAWAGQATTAWPDVETSATTTVSGFAP